MTDLFSIDHNNQIGHNDLGDLSIQPHYDHQGNITGFTEHNIFGGHTTYDSHFNNMGHTEKNILNQHDTFNSHGDNLGHTIDPGVGHHNFMHSDGHLGNAPDLLNNNPDFNHSQIHDHFSNIRTDLLNNIY